MRANTTIFKQLILNIIIPVVIALFVLAGLNYYRTQSILTNSNDVKNFIISDEIQSILRFQDYTLELIETDLDKQIEGYSKKLVNEVFSQTNNIEILNLDSVRNVIGMDSSRQDIYIINENGIVVNTTFKKDLGLNFFDFGEAHKNHLLEIMEEGKFVSERFSIETSTKELKKYTYQPTLDGKYIIEIGVYSSKASRVVESFKEHLNSISTKQENIVNVEMFVGEDNPISFNKEASLNEKTKETLLKTFETKVSNKLFIESADGIPLSYEFIYMERKSTNLYKGAVIQIVNDMSIARDLLKTELLQLGIVFVLTIFLVIVLIYNKAKVITQPIKKLVDNVNRITEGNFEERAEVEGNNEIATLSEQFNVMVSNLEDSYNTLEQKVEDRTAEILKQKNEIEEQKKHIMDSIHYAKRIQNAILPSSEFVDESLPNSFLLYKPKDIVSGDFYWMSKKDDKVLFAAVDCTGHGVPGAFMSIVGHNQLNYAVNVGKARKPSDILNQLNTGVTNVLNQQQKPDGVKDGMDIALCSLDYQTNTLEFSAAFNPIYLVRNNEIEEIKGNKFPIGAFIDEKSQKFENHTIKLKKGDTFYIFSDGYADQFGGPKGKKFKYKQFKNLLLEIQSKSMAEQKAILDETFERWKGNIEQIDDILVIGVRI